jgi:hypothetical protein
MFLSVVSSYGSIPTVEGLFRNPSNGEVTQKTAVIRFAIERRSSLVSEGIQQEPAQDQITKHYVKYIFDTNLKTRVRAIQAIYKTKEMNGNDLVSVRYISNISEEKLVREKKLFLAILSSLTLNRSNELMNYLKGISKDVKYNKENYDEEKKKLLSSYKNYLTDKKENNETETQNPMKPELLEEKEKIDVTMKRPLFIRSETTKLRKKNRSFYWEVVLDNFQGEFENENLKMRKMEFNNLSSIDQFSFENYLLIDGIHSFPKIINMTILDDKYKVEVLRMIHIESKNKSLKTRMKAYNKKLKSNDVTDFPIDYPFL